MEDFKIDTKYQRHNSHVVTNIKLKSKMLLEISMNQFKEKNNVINIPEDLILKSRLNTHEIQILLQDFIPYFNSDDLVKIQEISKLIVQEKVKCFTKNYINELFLQLDLNLENSKLENNNFILTQKIVETIAIILAILFHENRKNLKKTKMEHFKNIIEAMDSRKLKLNESKNIFYQNLNLSEFEISLNLTDILKNSNLSESLNSKLSTDNREKPQPDLCNFSKKSISTKMYFQKLSFMFENIKTLIIIPPVETETQLINIKSYLLVMLNLSWMFKNILEVDINYDSFSNIRKLGKLCKPLLHVFFIISYYIPVQIKNLISLKINIPYSFHSEMKLLMNKVSKNLPDGFHILEFFQKYDKLNNFEINFNALDPIIFSKILHIIYKNRNIRRLNMNLFPIRTEFYSKILLKNFSLFENEKVEKEIFQKNRSKSNLSLIVYPDEKINNYLSMLYDKFEINIEFLFSVISIRLNKLNTFNTIIDIPEIILNNDKYVSIIQKFFFDILSYVEMGSNSFQTIGIASSNLIIDKRKYQNVNSYIDKLNLNLTGNKSLLNLYLNLKFHKISEVIKFIPHNSLEFLKLGELDMETFKAFANFYTSESIPNLKFLHIVISSTNPSPDENHEEIKKFIQSKKSKNLQEVVLNLKLFFKHFHVLDLINSIPDDNIKSYQILFSETMIIDIHLLRLQYDFEENIPQTLIKFCVEKYPKYLSIVNLCMRLFDSASNYKLSKMKNIVFNILQFLKIKKEKLVVFKLQ